MMISEIKPLSLSGVITLHIAGISWEFSLLLCAEFKDLCPFNLLIMQRTYNSVCGGDVMKFSNPKVLSSSGIRGTKFIPVYNFPAQ